MLKIYPRITLKLESIGDAEYGDVLKVRSGPWVAKITGTDKRFGFAREFLRPVKDYSEGNGQGSRGFFLYYHLREGLYEVRDLISWQREDRYYCLVTQATLKRITKEEVLTLLQNAG